MVFVFRLGIRKERTIRMRGNKTAENWISRFLLLYIRMIKREFMYNAGRGDINRSASGPIWIFATTTVISSIKTDR